MASLSTLDDQLRPVAEEFYRIAHSVISGLVVTSARRSYFDQMRLFATYQAKKEWALWQLGRISFGMVDIRSQELTPAEMKEYGVIPASRPGTSKHELGLAFDIARLNVDPWKDDLLPILGSIWNRVGGTWRPSDPVHFEV